MWTKTKQNQINNYQFLFYLKSIMYRKILLRFVREIEENVYYFVKEHDPHWKLDVR